MKKLIQTLMLATLLSACSLLDIPLEDKVTDPWAITNSESALRALSNVYSSYSHWKYMVPLTAMGDDCMPTIELPKKIELRNAYYLTSTELITQATSLWGDHYATIMHANTITERVPLIKNASADDLKKLPVIIKEANALKALSYFRLMQLFSPRYLPLEAEKQPGAVYKKHVKLEYNPRMSLKATADTIRRLLTPYMEETAPLSNSIYRFSPLAARCLAAELELWTQNYEKAISLCEPFVQSMDMNATSAQEYDKFWAQDLPNSKEAIFNIDYSAFKGANFFDDWTLNNRELFLVNSVINYADADIRRAPSITPVEVHLSGKKRLLFKMGKYNTVRSNSKHIRYVSIYRASDFVFICAEAYARAGKAQQAHALMNRYLKSRGAEAIAGNVQNDALINRILNEKQKEFLGEGKRFFDLKRAGNIPLLRNLLLNDPLVTIKPDDYRWTLPIPSSEFKFNKAITENNKGWEFLMTPK